MFLLPFFRDFCFLLFLFAAAVFDFRQRRVPNLLLLSCLLFVSACYVFDQTGFRDGAFLAMLLLVFCIPLHACAMLGGADIKMMALLLYAYPGDAGVRMLLFSFSMAALFGTVRLFRNGGLRKRMLYFCSYMEAAAGGLRLPYYDRKRDGDDGGLPMMVFFFLGTAAGLLC